MGAALKKHKQSVLLLAVLSVIISVFSIVEPSNYIPNPEDKQ